MELRSVGKGDLRGLCGHGVGDGLNAMTDADDCGLAGSVEILLVVRRKNPRAFAADGGEKCFVEVSRKESGHGEIVAEAKEDKAVTPVSI